MEQADLMKYHGITQDKIKYNVTHYLIDHGALPDNHTATVDVGEPNMVDDYMWCRVSVHYEDSQQYKHLATTVFYYYPSTELFKVVATQ
jgi:hypothetical protein